MWRHTGGIPLQPCAPYCIHLRRTLMVSFPLVPLTVMRKTSPTPRLTTPESNLKRWGGGAACVEGKLTSDSSKLSVSVSENVILRFMVFLLFKVRVRLMFQRVVATWHS